MEWNGILDSFNFDKYIQLNDVYGCPDCQMVAQNGLKLPIEGIELYLKPIMQFQVMMIWLFNYDN